MSLNQQFTSLMDNSQVWIYNLQVCTSHSEDWNDNLQNWIGNSELSIDIIKWLSKIWFKKSFFLHARAHAHAESTIIEIIQ